MRWPSSFSEAIQPDEAERCNVEVSDAVLIDQHGAFNRNMMIAIPVNSVLAFAVLLVAIRAGDGSIGAAWFLAALTVNTVRLLIGRARPSRADLPLPAARIRLLLRASMLTAGLSGCVWAFLPFLSSGLTTPQAIFYLTVTCGVTAGAITHGSAYVRSPIAFITPPLLSIVFCLVLMAPTFDRACLALTVSLYLAALLRSAFQSEAIFRDASRLKHEARALAASLAHAKEQALAVAEKMTYRAAHDPLTDLLNRAGFLDGAEARHASGRESAVLLLDLDGFKAVNDLQGHKAGDRVLIEIAARLRRSVPPDALVARLGGDEFAVFWDPRRRGERPLDLAERILGLIGTPIAGLDATHLGASVGIRVASDSAVDEMLLSADIALYEAKHAGRNRACLFDDTLRTELARKHDLERDLAEALRDDCLEVWFQPILADGGYRLSSLEALLRWTHPQHGAVPPPEAIATAATVGLSDVLLSFILDRSCRMIRALDRSGRPSIGITINVSPREMAELPVDTMLLGRLAEHGLQPRRVTVEVTEETALDVQATRGKLTALAGAGIRIALDDFGVGYSSLASLRDLRPDLVKIDRCFVTGIANSTDDLALVKAVLGLGRELGFEVVAEGVETEADRLTLEAAGCPFMQGYLLGRPAPADAILFALTRADFAASGPTDPEAAPALGATDMKRQDRVVHFPSRRQTLRA